jgi:hypothetical protein
VHADIKAENICFGQPITCVLHELIKRRSQGHQQDLPD